MRGAVLPPDMTQPAKMSARAKIVVGLIGVALAVGAIAFAQERRQTSILADVRGSLAVGDSREKVETVLRGHGIQPKVSEDGHSYTAQVWFHFRPDVAVTVVLTEDWEVEKVLITEHIE